MASLANQAKNTSSLTNQGEPARGSMVFYGWLFLFTVPLNFNALSNRAVGTASLTNQSKH